MDLIQRRCEPCEKGTPPMSRHDAVRMHEVVPDWTLDPGRIHRAWTLRNFVDALSWVHDIGELAEAEGHHPDLHLTGYKHVRADLTTHAVGGLSENDFILAAKIDDLWGRRRD